MPDIVVLVDVVGRFTEGIAWSKNRGSLVRASRVSEAKL